MAEHKSKLQSNVNWLETFRLGRKAPVVANRIFDTFRDAQAYVDDTGDSATEGIRITVLNDSEENNGVYYVEYVANGTDIQQGKLVKICRSQVAWFKGNSVTTDGQVWNIPRAVTDDIYMNNETLDIFRLTENGTWELLCNLRMTHVDNTAPYYILSVDGTEHPEFDPTEWVKGNEDGDNIPHNYEDYNSGQVYLWTRLWDDSGSENYPKYSVALVYSSISLGTFAL